MGQKVVSMKVWITTLHQWFQVGKSASFYFWSVNIKIWLYSTVQSNDGSTSGPVKNYYSKMLHNVMQSSSKPTKVQNIHDATNFAFINVILIMRYVRCYWQCIFNMWTQNIYRCKIDHSSPGTDWHPAKKSWKSIKCVQNSFTISLEKK